MDVRGYVPLGYRAPQVFTINSHDTSKAIFVAAVASAGYPAANLAIYVPIYLATPATVYETWVNSGSLTTSNATEIGVYDTAGTRLFTQATTVAVASDTINSSGMTDYTLDTGTYYLAFGCDGTRNFQATAHSVGLYQSMGCMQQTGLTGANLPSTATFAVYAQSYLPVFGLNLRADAL